MFKISPINDKEIQKKFAEECQSIFKPEFFGYSMIDNETGDTMGFAQFDINEKGGYIADLRPKEGLSDFEAMFILGRATMNFIDLCGAHTCYASKDSADPRLLHAIGFKTEVDGLLFSDMNGMFDGNCGGEK